MSDQTSSSHRPKPPQFSRAGQSALVEARGQIDSGPARRRQSNRLPTGGLIERAQTLTFTFDGQLYAGHPGDTLASALLANGVHLVGRSFKYHRPRGILTAGPEEPNALVELREGARREPNTRATTAELYDGLIAASQNRWPSLRCYLMAINSLFAPIMSAGFYYKTFMWPAAFWEKVYEPMIRRAAGLGRAAGDADPDTYEKANLHCDVLVIGGGAAGLMAALAAGRTGLRVVLCEQDFRLGGRLIADNRVLNDRSSADWVAQMAAELAALPDVRILLRSTVFGVYDHGTYAALERVNDHVAVPPEYEPRQRLWRIHARRCVLAAGAIERPLVFGDNDRPGVMLAGAVRTYLNRYAVAPGRRAVVFSTSDETAATVSDLARAGIAIAAVIDARGTVPPGIEVAARVAGARLIAGGAIVRALGRARVRAVAVRTATGATEQIGSISSAFAGGGPHRSIWRRIWAAAPSGTIASRPSFLLGCPTAWRWRAQPTANWRWRMRWPPGPPLALRLLISAAPLANPPKFPQRMARALSTRRFGAFAPRVAKPSWICKTM